VPSAQAKSHAEAPGLSSRTAFPSSVDDSESFDEGRNQVDQTQKTIFELLIAGGDPPELFHLVDQSLDLVPLLWVGDALARAFYEDEALRGGWTFRQIATKFCERTLLSNNKAAVLHKGAAAKPADAMTSEEAIKDAFVLEFLNLKDEYSESDLEEALIDQLQNFLMELGGDFAFVARQRRLRIGDEWYRIDLLFFHRRLRCLVVIDLKLGKFTHSDAGQMHLYLNYAREHWTNSDEKPPVGLILCTHKDQAVAHYSLEGLPNKIMASESRLNLPDEAVLTAELRRSRRRLEDRRGLKGRDMP
jgi:predicted nuclease of restriction endonuclease-like (RecB) superfamily